MSRLYTVNQWNRQKFLPREEDLYSLGGVLGSIGSSVKDAWGNLGSQEKQDILDMGLEIPGKMKIPGTKRGLYDAADPLYWAANGNESVVGNAVSDIGVGLFKASAKSGNLMGMAAGGITKGVGSLINASMGTKVDKEALNRTNAGTNYLKNFNSTATTTDEVTGPMAVQNAENAYGAGWFRKGWARRRNRKLRNERAYAQDWAYRALDNNINNIARNQIDMGLANYTAFGGPIDTYGMPFAYPQQDGMTATGYNMMSDYLTLKKAQAESKGKVFAKGGKIHINPKNRGKFNATKKRTGKTTEELTHSKNPLTRKRAIFAQNARKWRHDYGGPLFAFGGDMETNGSDFPTGLMHIGVNESHEENPYGGVKIGEDRNGTPNLLEGGEVVWNDYVYSNRLFIDDATKEKFHIGKKREMTYADLAKKLEREISERANDPISESGFNAQMQTLQEEQERQKQEMEAERAREAFEALPPEEQVAIMDRANQEEQMAQQAMQEQAIAQQAAEQQGMVQQPTPEEAAIMQQQVPQEQMAMVAPQEMAYGGNLYDKGGPKITPYAYSNNWEGFKYFNPEKNEYTPEYLNFVQNILNQDWINRIMSGKYGDLSRYLARNKGITPTLAQIIALASDKKYSDMHKAVAAAYEDYLRGVNPATGDIMTNGVNAEDTSGVTTTGGYTVNGVTYPTWEEAEAASRDYAANLYNNIMNSNVGTRPDATSPEVPSLATPTLTGNSGIDELNNSQGKPIKVVVNGGTPTMPIDDSLSESDKASLYDFAQSAEGKATLDAIRKRQTNNNGEDISAPKDHWMRYAGLFGPAVGLGLMAAGVGKPDYSRLDAAVEGLGNPTFADWKPIGNYLTYRPMDIWYMQNRMDANARATDRAIANNAAPVGTKMAGLLANSYNNQIASGNLFRQALEYNDALRKQVEDFNRGTNLENSKMYANNSQFNAQAANQHNQTRARLGLAAAQQRLDSDAGWYNSLYGNVAGLFKGVSDLGRDKTEKSWLEWLEKRGAFGNTGRNTAAYGGKIKTKKRRGFTY